MPRILWEPRPRGDGWWSAGLDRDEGVSLTGDNALHFVGAPPSGRWVVVCEGYRDEGVAPTGAKPRILWETRPRGDSSWFARVIATGASLLLIALLWSGGEGGVDVLQGGQGVVSAQGVQAQA